MSEETKEETKTKLRSRKFGVWITATLFETASFIAGFIIKDFTLAQDFMPWWGGISMLYIGGNVAQKFVQKTEDQVECSK